MSYDAGVLQRKIEEFERRIDLLYSAMSDCFLQACLIEYSWVFARDELQETLGTVRRCVAILEEAQEGLGELFTEDVEHVFTHSTPKLGIPTVVEVSEWSGNIFQFDTCYRAFTATVDLLLGKKADKRKYPSCCLAAMFESRDDQKVTSVWWLADQAVKLRDGLRDEISRAKTFAAEMDEKEARESATEVGAKPETKNESTPEFPPQALNPRERRVLALIMDATERNTTIKSKDIADALAKDDDIVDLSEITRRVIPNLRKAGHKIENYKKRGYFIEGRSNTAKA